MNGKFKDFLSYHIYQIYPRSFNDSNGDGIGDLRGVIEKLDYLKDLGINAIWLCPCYKSPNEDNGYDIADYRDIMDEFGTMADAEELIAEMHKRGMKLIMDLVPNHTSSLHKWFKESRKSKDNPYSDYYYWFDEKPNDWQSCFSESAWAFDEMRGQYYLHSYATGQPDLNWENPAVVKEMQDVIDFWVAKGVDGFRIDVIDQISKDIANNKFVFGPRLHEFIQAMFNREQVAHIFTVGECWANDIDEVRRHCAADRGELSTLFQFNHLNCGRSDKYTPRFDSISKFWGILRDWQISMQENDLLYSLFCNNHDQSWLLSRMGDAQNMRYESATCIAALIYLMRGCCFIYQGEEIGSINSKHDTIEEFNDIESVNMYKAELGKKTAKELIDGFNFGGRDNTRRPMAWNGDKNGGFTTGTPWVPVNVNYKEINVAAEQKAEKSVWRFYRDLLHLRADETALTAGTFEVVQDADTHCIYRRQDGDSKILVVCAFDDGATIDLPDTCGELLLSNYGHTEKKDGNFAKYEIAVYREK